MSASNSPAPNSHSASPAPAASRHAHTPLDRQRSQLERLLKDPSKPAFVPLPPKERTIRPAREMMKNVQGSSAGAGSGEFHVYKASRRREYERLKIMEEESTKEKETAEFERRRKEAADIAEAKTAKNRAKRQKKKERAKTKPSDIKAGPGEGQLSTPDVPLKKRRLVNGKELVFKKPGEDSDSDDGDEDGPEPSAREEPAHADSHEAAPLLAEEPRIATEHSITIYEDD